MFGKPKMNVLKYDYSDLWSHYGQYDETAAPVGTMITLVSYASQPNETFTQL